MVDDVVSLEEHRRSLSKDDPAAPDEADDLFLVEEGLELIAAYRVIADHDVRQTIRTLVEQFARRSVSSI